MKDEARNGLRRTVFSDCGMFLLCSTAAGKPDDMDLPGFRLHPLKGELKGHWAVTVSGNWRVTFRFEGGDAYEVDYLDYH